VRKTERDIERAQAEAVLATRQAELNRDVQLAKISATRKAEAQDQELVREVQIKRAAAEMERMRATDVVKATIARESKQQAADAKAYEIEAEAKANYEKDKQNNEAGAYKIKIDTDVAAYKTKADAEAFSHATIAKADANLQAVLKQAEGMSAMADAYGKMSQAFGGPAGLLLYMMIEKGTYVELATANAEAIRGLQPKISIWNTGAEAGAGGAAGGEGGAGAGNQSSVATMRNIYQMLPPLMTTINDQTGINLPEWQFGRLAGAMSENERANDKPNGQK
jgi:flotillin